MGVSSYCRAVVSEINENTLVEILRKQSEKLDKALEKLESILSNTENVLEQDARDVGVRVATMFIIGLWSKLKDGASSEKLTNDDWKFIIGNAYEYAVAIDPKDYSQLVFELYRKSIAFAIEPMRPTASPYVISRLEEIVSLMEGFAEDLESGSMSETKYIDESMWLSLEAIFLILTDRLSHKHLPEERQELAEAVSSLVFQNIRDAIFDRELVVIDECLKHQGELDQKLTEQVNAYKDALNNELDEFDALVEIAFNTDDFQAAFRGSVDLAEMLGAESILQTEEDIDDYFLS